MSSLPLIRNRRAPELRIQRVIIQRVRAARQSSAMKTFHRILFYTGALILGFGIFAAIYFTVAAKVKYGTISMINPKIIKKTDKFATEKGSLDEELDKPEDPNHISRMMKEAENDNKERLLTVQKICKKYGLEINKRPKKKSISQPTTPLYHVFFIDVGHQLAVCPVREAGASTWFYNLCLLAGMTDQEIRMANTDIRTLARTKYPKLEPGTAERALQKTMKIMTVRHPFERLLAAYRNKLENLNFGERNGSLDYYNKYGKEIVNKYRKGGNATKTKKILSPSQYMKNPAKFEPTGIEPTFQEFVRYLIDTDLNQASDENWAPYNQFCTPCLLRYGVIAKFETLARDILFSIRLLGLDGIITPVWQRNTQFLSEFISGEKVSQVGRVYFQQLTVNEIQMLYQKYRVDFELFGYNYQDYIQYAQDYNTRKLPKFTLRKNP